MGEPGRDPGVVAMRGLGAVALTTFTLAIFACVVLNYREDAADATVTAEVEKPKAHKHSKVSVHHWNPSQDSKGIANAAQKAARAARAVARAAKASSEKTAKHASVINSAQRKAKQIMAAKAHAERAKAHAALRGLAKQRHDKHKALRKIRKGLQKAAAYKKSMRAQREKKKAAELEAKHQHHKKKEVQGSYACTARPKACCLGCREAGSTE